MTCLIERQTLLQPIGPSGSANVVNSSLIAASYGPDYVGGV